MARTKDELPPWAKILLAIIIVGGLIWALVPKEILYLSIGIVVVIIGVASYIILRRQGTQPFKTLAKRTYGWLTESRRQKGKPPRTPIPLEIRRAVYRRADNYCQHPNCGRTEHPIIHHVDGDRTNHNLNNLILLCREHAAKADSHNYTIEQLKNWMTQPGAPRYHSRSH